MLQKQTVANTCLTSISTYYDNKLDLERLNIYPDIRYFLP
jgi:hypothetical protein